MFLHADDGKIIFNNSSDVVKDFTVEFYSDESNSLTVFDIQKNINFKRTNSKFSFGYIKSTLWFKIDFENKSFYDNFILTLSEHFYEIANLYYFDKSLNTYTKIENGVFMLLKDR